MEENELISELMERLCDDFSHCLKISKDFNFDFIDKINMEVKIKKPFKLVAIQNNIENIQHVAIIVSKLGNEYKMLVKIIENFLLDNLKSVQIITKDHFEDSEEFYSNRIIFTNNIYLYTDKIIVPEIELRNHFDNHRLKLIIRDDCYRENHYKRKTPDIFIMHDSRDKDFARSLYDDLTKRFLKVWFDEYSLNIGDSLTEKIEEGLKSCRYGILILSKNFLSNEKWAKNELQSLKVRQIVTNKNLILPIWLNITEEDLVQYSPWLLDKKAVKASESLESIINKIIRVIKNQ